MEKPGWLAMFKARSHSFVSDYVVIACLASVWILVVALVNPSGNFPLNDDWVYGLVVRNILTTGHFRFISPASANFFTQAYWGTLFCLPVGFSFFALRMSTLVLAGLGIISLYSVCREMGGAMAVSTLAALLLAFNPLYLGLANSFMTDVPFTALIIISLYFFSIALKRDSAILFFLCCAISFVALGIRQYGLIFIGAICIGYLVKKGLRWIPVINALGTFTLAVGLQFAYTTWLLKTGQIRAEGDLSIQFLQKGGSFVLESGRLNLLFSIIVYVGAFTLPLLFVYQRCTFKQLKMSGISFNQVLLLVVSVFSAIELSLNRLPRLGNILTDTGMGPLTLRDTYILNVNLPVPNWHTKSIWDMLTVCGALGAVLILLLLAQSAASLSRELKFSSLFSRPLASVSTSSSPIGPWLLATLLTNIIAYSTLLALGSPFDRYVLPLYPLVMMLVVYSLGSRFDFALFGHLGRAMTLSILCLYAFYSVGSSHDYMALNRARWQALDDLTSKYDVSPNLIDGGYEFNGWHLSSKNYKPTADKSHWWVDRDDYIIAIGPIPGYKAIARYPFRRWLPIKTSPVVILRRTHENQ